MATLFESLMPGDFFFDPYDDNRRATDGIRVYVVNLSGEMFQRSAQLISWQGTRAVQRSVNAEHANYQWWDLPISVNNEPLENRGTTQRLDTYLPWLANGTRVGPDLDVPV